MGYAFLLCTTGAVVIVMGALAGGMAWFAVWPGINMALLGWACARGGHGLYGKRPDGTLPAWSWLVFFPWIAYAWVLWHLLRLVQHEPACSEVDDSLVIGRRLLASEFKGGFDNVIDLTAEFSEPLPLRTAAGYRSFPILDGTAPPVEQLAAVVRSLKPGPTFVHCAQGHGRTALFASAVLLVSGRATSVEDAFLRLKSVRPRVRLNRAQRTCLETFAARLGTTPHQGWDRPAPS